MERKNYLVPVLVLLIFFLVGAVLYLLVKDNNVDDNNDKENNETVKWEVKTERLYTGTRYFKIEEDIDNNGSIKYYTEEENIAILFKPDKTFVMVGGIYAFRGYEGTYSVNGNLLTLTANKEYGSDAGCYNINEVIEKYEIYEVNGNQRLYSIPDKEKPGELGMNLLETTKEAENEKEKKNYTTGFLDFLLNPTGNYEPCVDR